VHEIEARQFILPDGIHHRLIRTIGDGLADSRFLAFELIPETNFNGFRLPKGVAM